MNQIMEFLAEYYLYVALGSLVIIIILILIIFMSKKRERRKENEQIVNMGDIKTGTIDEVANNISQNNDAFMQPQDIGEVTTNIPVINNEEIGIKENEGALEPQPIMESMPSIEAPVENTVESPMPSIEVPVENTVESPMPSIEVPVENTVEAPIPSIEVPVENTVESPIPSIEVPVENTVESPIPSIEVPVENTVESPIPSIEVPAESAPIEPESLEVFGIDDDEPKGTAVAGFSSVNVEK